MKNLRLGFTDTNDQIARFFHKVLSQKYNITLDNENPECLIFGDNNFGNNNLQYNPDTCVKIFYTGENQRPWHYKAHFSITFDHHIQNNYRLPLYVIYDWDNKRKGIGNYSTHKRSIGDIKKKTDFCSFVVRNPSCEKRNNFFHKLSTYKQVTSGGPLFNNIGYVLEYHDKAMESKLAWLPKFKFNLCFENNSYPGYATEKIYEAFIGGTVPIYWGSPTIEVDFNKKAFLDLNDYEDEEEFLEAIKRIDKSNDLYTEMYMQPMFNNGYNKFMDLDRFLSWFDRNIYGVIYDRQNKSTLTPKVEQGEKVEYKFN